jgi:hypothetical protein
MTPTAWTKLGGAPITRLLGGDATRLRFSPTLGESPR